MKIGITGHTGFIGSHVKNYLNCNSHSIVLSKTNMLSFGNDLGKFEEFRDCDVIVHMAGKNKGSDKEIIEMNVFAAFSLLSWCKTYGKRIIVAGSDYKHESAYKTSKDTVKLLCKSYGHAGLLNSSVMNFPKVIGPRCKPFYNSFVTTLIYSAANGTLHHEKRNIKNLNEIIELIHVDDLCDEILLTVERPHYGFEEYEFTKYDGKFQITLNALVEILEGKPNLHEKKEMILELVEWYKENPNG